MIPQSETERITFESESMANAIAEKIQSVLRERAEQAEDTFTRKTIENDTIQCIQHLNAALHYMEEYWSVWSKDGDTHKLSYGDEMRELMRAQIDRLWNLINPHGEHHG